MAAAGVESGRGFLTTGSIGGVQVSDGTLSIFNGYEVVKVLASDLPVLGVTLPHTTNVARIYSRQLGASIVGGQYISLYYPTVLEFDTVIWKFRLSHTFEGVSLSQPSYSYYEHGLSRDMTYTPAYASMGYRYLTPAQRLAGWQYKVGQENPERFILSSTLRTSGDIFYGWKLDLIGNGRAVFSAVGGDEDEPDPPEVRLKADVWYEVTMRLLESATTYVLSDSEGVLATFSSVVISNPDRLDIDMDALTYDVPLTVEFEEIRFGECQSVLDAGTWYVVDDFEREESYPDENAGRAPLGSSTGAPWVGGNSMMLADQDNQPDWEMVDGVYVMTCDAPLGSVYSTHHRERSWRYSKQAYFLDGEEAFTGTNVWSSFDSYEVEFRFRRRGSLPLYSGDDWNHFLEVRWEWGSEPGHLLAGPTLGMAAVYFENSDWFTGAGVGVCITSASPFYQSSDFWLTDISSDVWLLMRVGFFPYVDSDGRTEGVVVKSKVWAEGGTEPEWQAVGQRTDLADYIENNYSMDIKDGASDLYWGVSYSPGTGTAYIDISQIRGRTPGGIWQSVYESSFIPETFEASPGWNTQILAVTNRQFTIGATPTPGSVTVFDSDGGLLTYGEEWEEADDDAMVYDLKVSGSTVMATFHVQNPALGQHIPVSRAEEQRQQQNIRRGPSTPL